LTGSRNSFSISSLLLNYDPSRAFSKHYSKGDKLGEGGFGAVYRCQHLVSKDIRALKIIPKSHVQKDMEYVTTEIEALLRIDHPNIVKMYEFFEQKHDILVVVELCNGGDFSKLFRSKCPMETVRPLFRDIVLGVAYCHDLQIVHRDLKFENCLLTEGRRRKMGKVIDFGLSAIRRDTNVDADRTPKSSGDAWLSEALGTKFFAAPEVIDKSRKYGTSCDIWSLGVMLYIMYTNEHPFAKNATSMDTAELFSKILAGKYREEPLKASKVPAVAVTLLRGMLAMDPQRRISALEALKSPWLRPVTFTELHVSSALSRQRSTDIAQRLSSWSGTSHFEKVLLMLVAHQAKQREVEDMRAAFVAMDTDGNGSLSKQELAQGLKSIGHAMPAASVDDMYRWLDSNENSKLDYSEWLCATMEPALIEAEYSMRELFDFFDSDANGYVSRQELLRVATTEEAEQVFLQTDTSRDGRIDYEEFKVFMQSVAKLRSHPH